MGLLNVPTACCFGAARRTLQTAANSRASTCFCPAACAVQHWGGFLLRPLSIEFWQGRPSRLHDRLRYVRQSVDSQEWRLERLAP